MGSLKALQEWCRIQCENYTDVEIKNMSASFRDGLAFCAIIHRHRPDLIDFDSLSKDNVYENNRLAFETAESELGIPALLDPEDMVSMKVPDRLSVITYVSQYYNYFTNKSHANPPCMKRPSGTGHTEPAVKRPVVLDDERAGEARSAPAPTGADDQSKRGTLSSTCAACQKHVHLVQRFLVDGKLYHRNCFRCRECCSTLLPGSYKAGSEAGSLVCTHHFAKSFSANQNGRPDLSRLARPTWARPPKVTDSCAFNGDPGGVNRAPPKPRERSHSPGSSSLSSETPKPKDPPWLALVHPEPRKNRPRPSPSPGMATPQRSGSVPSLRGGVPAGHPSAARQSFRGRRGRGGSRSRGRRRSPVVVWSRPRSTKPPPAARVPDQEHPFTKSVSEPSISEPSGSSPNHQPCASPAPPLRPRLPTPVRPPPPRRPIAARGLKAARPPPPTPVRPSPLAKTGAPTPPPPTSSHGKRTCKENPFNRKASPSVTPPKSRPPKGPRPARPPAPGHGFPLIKRKVQSDQYIPVEDIHVEMGQLERQLDELEQRGVELESKLRDCQNDEEEEVMLVDWFTLIHDKHMLVRREAELVYTAKQQNLEERQADVEYELRCLLNKPEKEWSEEDRAREQELMAELVTIIEQRNHIINSMDQDRQREEEEDKVLEAMLKKKDFHKEADGEHKKKGGKFKPMKVLKMLSQKGEGGKSKSPRKEKS
ncbi:hypothetical protein ANANG_G00032210 [Anguilla anguilla]|uniref:MICAL-like protein 1 n=1 Tax=Anguilla anguilla TaxID=7936 RepID=A0A9D3MVA1_ANGAN|nr:hypothetical protein ANANG_G00032210 [Anguilla anguilla]